MDICSGPCKYYYIRDPQTANAAGVVQVPETVCVPAVPEILLTGIISLMVENNTNSHVDLRAEIAGKVIEFSFKWEKSDTQSDALPVLISGYNTISLERTTKEEAETIMVFGRLDYFKATGMFAKDTSATKLTLTYQGKIEPTD